MAAISGWEGSLGTFFGAIFLQFVLIPIVVGVLASLLVWRRRLGNISVQRMLTYDGTSNTGMWKLVVTSRDRPVERCKVRFGKEIIRWDGIGTSQLDIGQGGRGHLTIRNGVYDPDTIVMVKSGSFTIFRKSFRNLPEVSAPRKDRLYSASRMPYSELNPI